jgi:DNA-directed RNA polymerase subunit RPC12/RpoP
VIHEPKIDRAILSQLYAMSMRMTCPVEQLLNRILRENIEYYKLILNEVELVKITAPDLSDVLTLQRRNEKYPNRYVCPRCGRNFDVRIGVVKVESLKVLDCHRCGEPTEDTG